MARGELGVEHLLRRAGFGASQDDLKQFEGMSVSGGPAVSARLRIAAGRRRLEDWHAWVCVDQSRQRLLSESEHRPRAPALALPDDSYASARSRRRWRSSGTTTSRRRTRRSRTRSTGFQATRMLALKPGELPGPQGQIELFRSMALGSFRDLLIEVAKDPAMLVLARRTSEHAPATAGKLRPRNHGALHVRPR